MSVNSFGFGGTNAHAVLDDAAHYLAEAGIDGQHNTFLFPDDPLKVAVSTPRCSPRTQLFVFSGHDEAALTRVLGSQTQYVDGQKATENFAANYAYTLFSRRSRLECVTFTVAQSADELLRKLNGSDTATPIRLTRNTPRIALVFCGQGAQWHAMGRELMEYEVFGSSVARASRYLQDSLQCAFCLLDELRRDKEKSRIGEPQIAQPATTAIQIALVDLLRASQVEPVAVVGHSSGEMAAAYAIGALSSEDAWKIAYHRGRCAAILAEKPAAPRGAMLAVPLSEEVVQTYIDRMGLDAVDVACVNGPTSLTLSGDDAQIDEIRDAFAAEHVHAVRLRVSTAYHSRHMQLVEDDYRNSIRDVRAIPNPPTTAVFYSSLYGRAAAPEDLDAEYWVQNLVLPVQFFKAVDAMARESAPTDLIEVGPHCVWEVTLGQIFSHAEKGDLIQSCSTLLYRGRDAAVQTLKTMGRLWMRGCTLNLDWAMARSVYVPSGSLEVACSKPDDERPRHLIDLPTYPWDHSRKYWHESHLSEANRFRAHGREDIIGAPLENSPVQEPCWRGFFRVQENPWLEDHVIQKAIVYPAGGMIAMTVEAAKQVATLKKHTFTGVEVSDFVILKPMRIPTSSHGLENTIRTKLVDQPATYEFSILSKLEGAPWTVHATGRFAIEYQINRATKTRAAMIRATTRATTTRTATGTWRGRLRPLPIERPTRPSASPAT